MSEENKTLVRRVFDEAWNKGKVAALDEIFASDDVYHELPPGLPPGIEGTKAYLGANCFA